MYYHFNNVGSTTVVTDASGNVKYNYEYSPYGELIKGAYGQVMFLYNEQYGVISDDNGLYYMRARYYNIAIKRFCNQDVLTGEIGESQSLNRYAYVEGNPVSYFDPFGLQAKEAAESRRNQLNIAGVVMSGISLTAALVVGGALIFASNGALTPVIVDVGTSIGVGCTGAGLAAGIASEYEWAYDYEKGYVSYEEALEGVKNAAIGNALTLLGMKYSSKIAEALAKYVGDKVKYFAEKAIKEVINHFGDDWTLYQYYEEKTR